MPKQGPCAKRTVTATILMYDERMFVGTNYCLRPQETCPRGDMPGGVGYHLCRSVCHQPAHAEENAIEAAKDAGADVRGALMIVQGIEWVCQSCKKSVKDAGLRLALAPVYLG